MRVLTKHGHGAGTGTDGHGHHEPPSPVIGLVACGAVLLSFLTAVGAVIAAHGGSRPHASCRRSGPGSRAAPRRRRRASRRSTVDWAYQVDPLSSVMLLVVTFVGLLIHVYSSRLPGLGDGYMAHDPGYARYMSYLNLFMFAMLTLVLGANYLVLFVGWEGVGLCSYLLIGFWFDEAERGRRRQEGVHRQPHRRRRLRAGRVPDLHDVRHASDFRDGGGAAAAHLPVELAWSGALTVIGLLLFVGACGKSAQIPLYVWLPDAMEGPTPVSRAHPRRHHGDRRRLHDRALGRALRARAERRCWSSRSSAR